MATGLIVGLGALVAVFAAIRSTWSPCGLSMLSSITPFGERARGHRYGATAAWFVIGAVVGGACLGGLAAGLAAGLSAAGLIGHPAVVLALAGLAAAAAAAVDGGVFGPVIPLWRRQVDDAWLSRYRSWVYGSGFGWQIGSGLATYIMTAAVLLLVVLAGLTGSPLAAVLVCTGFGLVRGLAVLLTSRAADPQQLRQLHHRIHEAGPPVRRAVISAQAVVAVVLVGDLVAGGLGAGVAAVGGVGAAAVIEGVGRGRRRLGADTGAAPTGPVGEVAEVAHAVQVAQVVSGR
jgi:hypothetical protein